jgi:DNA-binding CsgD family transcriptional regulator
LIAWRRGDFELMRRHVDAAFARFGQWQDIIGVGVCHLTYGVLDRKLGRPAEAADHFEDAYKLHDLVAYEWGMATGRYYGGEAARDQGQSTLAAKLQREALNLYWRQGDYWGAGASMGGLAALCAQRGRYFVAAQLFGASDALCRRVGALLPPTELLAYEQIAADVRAHLGEKLYAIAVENGRQSSPEACVALAEAAAAGLLGETLADPWRDEANERTRALAALAGLTLKRRAILKLVAEGAETKEIAHQLKRDYNTIDTQLKAIQKAFDVETKTELIIRIYRTGVHEAL